MSTLTLNRQGKLKRQTNAEPYRRILDLQAKQKFYNNSRQRRLQTEPQFVTPHYSSSTQNTTEKKLIQYSTFLPAISKKNKINKIASKRQSYNQQYQEGNTTIIDTEYEAMQNINECQTIIQNLKKLTNYNKSRADKAQLKYLSPKRQSKMSHAYFNDINRSTLGDERQPSFFRSSGENFEHPYSANKKNVKMTSWKKYEGIFEEEGISKIQPPTSKRKQQANYEDFGQYDSRIKQQSQFSEEQNIESEESRFKIKDPKKKQQNTQSGKGNHEDSLISYSAQDPDSTVHQHKSNFSLKQQLEEDEESQQNIKKDDEMERQRKQKEEQSLRNAKKRQSILLKFLMKAKSRGSELQKKIIDHKTKNNMSMIYSRRSKIVNPEADDSNRVDMPVKHEQVEKEQEEDDGNENENKNENEKSVDIHKQADSKQGEQVKNNNEIDEDLILKMVEQNAE